ncbi:YopX family protein [Brevibacillus porteri]|uniref:YopX family protein n=1 Tax=Brevibacillus porteri TaxID=2126350 RepID=UPI003D2431B2
MQTGREIKFRAWDSKFKLHTFNERQEITDEYGESWKQPIWSPVEDAVIMQFTGLHDKNGKEIYEGDIVKNKHDAKGVIKFHKAWGHFVLIPSLVIMSSTVPMWNDWDTLTIIGNIYDKPELLEAS